MLVEYSDSEEDIQTPQTSSVPTVPVRESKPKSNRDEKSAQVNEFDSAPASRRPDARRTTPAQLSYESDPLPRNAASKRKRNSSPTQPLAAKLPPLPSSFQSLYATNVRTSTSDDPALHGGRRRQVAHVVGNWSTHIYLEWYPPTGQLEQLEDLIEQVQSKFHTKHASWNSGRGLHSFLRSELGAQLPLHVSLSAPLVLSTSEKEDFEDSFTDAMRRANVSQITVNPTTLSLVSNFDGTRSFLILRLSKPENDGLNGLLTVTNDCVRQFSLPTLYEKGAGKQWFPELSQEQSNRTPKSSAFHTSIAWTVEAIDVETRKEIEEMDLPQSLEDNAISFDTVKLKIGNVVKDITLS